MSSQSSIKLTAVRVALMIACAFSAVAAFGQTQVTYTDLHDFGGKITSGTTSFLDGEQPIGPVAIQPLTPPYFSIWGTASAGGRGSGGTLWSFTPGQGYGNAFFFSNTGDYYMPINGVSVDSNGVVWGTTSLGTGDGLFEYDGGFNPNVGNLNSWGANAGPNGWIYGTDAFDGVGGYGTLWVWKPAPVQGSWTSLHAFSPSTGYAPETFIVFDAAGDMFGNASKGGPNGGGVLWEYSAAGTYSVLHSFGGAIANANGSSGPDGSSPMQSLAFDAQGNLYGSTQLGGAHNQGMVWELTTSGKYIDLHDFGGTITTANGTQGADGEQPYGGVTIANGGSVYGTTAKGGPNSAGNVWVIAQGQYVDLHDFGGTVKNASGTTGPDGSISQSGVTVDPNGVLYGTCTLGGPNGQGMLWSLQLTPYTGTVKSLAISPASVVGGNNAQGTLTLASPAPAIGALVSVSSNNSAAIPATPVLVTAGTSSATFTIATAGVATTQTATITAGSGAAAATATLQVQPAALSSLTVNPTSVAGGNGATGTVTLNGLGATGGTPVSITIAGGTATAPASVKVPAGQNSATFSIGTSPVTSQETSTLTAGLNGATTTATLTINPAAILLAVISPSSVVGGNPATLTVKLNGPAATGGFPITLSSNSSSASVPSSATIAAGQSSVSVTITTVGVSTQTTAAISITGGGVTLPGSLTITPAAASTVALTPSSVTGGANSTGTVTLTGQAGPGGTTVNLTSSNTSVATVPSTVTLPAGQTSVAFTVTTLGVSSLSKSTITASGGGQSPTATITVNPAALAAVALNPTIVVGGSDSVGTVTLNGLAGPGGAIVALSGSEPIALQPTATVAAQQSSATFTVYTIAVNAQIASTVTATYAGQSQTATLTLTPPLLESVSVYPSTVVGGTSAEGLVVLSYAASGTGVTVGLSSSSSTVQMPATVVVPNGQSAATFPVGTNAVSSPANATITATLGNASVSTTLTVTPSVFLGITVSPTSVIGGHAATGTVWLTGAAGAGGVTVTLSSTSKAATVPATVVISAGNSSAKFNVTTSAVSKVVTAQIDAICGNAQDYAQLTITPPQVTALILNPTTLSKGGVSNGMVQLSDPAPTGGLSVTLTSSSKLTTQPATVTVKAGQAAGIFTVTAGSVTAPVSAVLTATLGSSQATATLNLVPVTLASLSLSPTSVIGGNSSTGTVTLSATAPSSGFTISLSSSSGSATVPASVLVQSGQTSAKFSVTTGHVSASTTATITATFGGLKKTAALTIKT